MTAAQFGGVQVRIESFGYLHEAPPAAHLTIDLRHHFKDPHVSPELRYMTAHDELVRTTVLNTPGVADLVEGHRRRGDRVHPRPEHRNGDRGRRVRRGPSPRARLRHRARRAAA